MFRNSPLLLPCINRESNLSLPEVITMKKPGEMLRFPLFTAVALMGATACGPASNGPDEEGNHLPDGETCESIFTKDVKLADDPDASIDYVINCMANVTGALTIEPGVQITFGPQGGLLVTSGSIEAKGTAEKPITLGGTTAERGGWQGLTVSSASPRNALEHVGIQHAGGNGQGALVVGPGARLSLKNSVIQTSKAHGVFVQDGANLTFENNNVTKNDKEPVNVATAQMSILDSASTFTNNKLDRILVRGGNLSEGEFTWHKLDVPYFFQPTSGTEISIDGTAKVTVEAGAHVGFDTDVGLFIGGSASLNAVGTSNEPVKFMAADDLTAVWAGLYFESASTSNVLDFVEVLRAGSASFYVGEEKASITVSNDKRLVLKNSTVRNGAGFGLLVHDGAKLSFEKNTFTKNAKEPLKVPFNLIAELDAASTLTGNTRDYVRIERGDVAEGTVTWHKLSVPYLIAPDSQNINRNALLVNGSAKVTIEAGTAFRFADDAGLSIEGNASLKAVGTSTSRVTFKGESATNAAWKGIYFESVSTDNVFDFIEVANAGSSAFDSNGYTGSILVEGSLTLTNSIIKGSGECGVNVPYFDGVLVQSDNTFSGATNDVCLPPI